MSHYFQYYPLTFRGWKNWPERNAPCDLTLIVRCYQNDKTSSEKYHNLHFVQNCALLLPQNEYLVFAKFFLSSLLSKIWPVSYIWRRPVKSEALRCLAQVLNCQCHLVNNVRFSIEKFHHRGDNSYSCHSSLHSLWLDSNSIVFSNSLYTQDRQISPLQLKLSLTLISRHFD